MRAPGKPTEEDRRAALVALLDERDAARWAPDLADLERSAKLFCSLSEVDQYKALRRTMATWAMVGWRKGDGGKRLRRLLPGIPPDAIRETPAGMQGVGLVQLQRQARKELKEAAIDDVLYLEKLWRQQNPRGRWKEKQLAIEVAAERHDLTMHEVREEMRRRGKPST